MVTPNMVFLLAVQSQRLLSTDKATITAPIGRRNSDLSAMEKNKLTEKIEHPVVKINKQVLFLTDLVKRILVMNFLKV